MFIGRACTGKRHRHPCRSQGIRRWFRRPTLSPEPLRRPWSC